MRREVSLGRNEASLPPVAAAQTPRSPADRGPPRRLALGRSFGALLDAAGAGRLMIGAHEPFAGLGWAQLVFGTLAGSRCRWAYRTLRCPRASGASRFSPPGAVRGGGSGHGSGHQRVEGRLLRSRRRPPRGERHRGQCVGRRSPGRVDLTMGPDDRRGLGSLALREVLDVLPSCRRDAIVVINRDPAPQRWRSVALAAGSRMSTGSSG